MENLVAHRLLLSAVLIAAMAIGALGFLFLKFPFNYGVSTLAVVAVFAALFYSQKREKAARHSAVSAVALEFGQLLSFDDYSVSFQRDKTVFDAEFPYDEDNTAFKVSFFIPKLFEKFVIQHNSISKRFPSDCEYVEPPPFSPEELILQSRNPEFLRRLLENKKVTSELFNYPSGLFQRFIIAFDEGNFEIEWTPKASEQIDGLYQICRTAVVFHDELKNSAATI